MKRFRIHTFFGTLFINLIVMLGVGLGHALFSQMVSSHAMDTKEVSSQCQSVCPPLFSEKQKPAGVQEDDAEPDPFPFSPVDTEQYVALAYAVALAALALLYLQRRPPDLVIQYASLRN